MFELGEMTAMGRSESEALKTFLSRNVDRYRGPYERTLKSVPRRCVFIGSTNADWYLRDTTGNRRFWPVRTSDIHLENLAADRSQLWAEAEAAGETIELSRELRPDASDAQQSRLINDPWTDTLADYLEKLKETRSTRTSCLTSSAARPGAAGGQTQYMAKRLREVMASFGWAYKRAIRIRNENRDGYEAPDGWTSKPDVEDPFPHVEDQFLP